MLSLLGCYALGAVLLSGDHIGVTAWPKPANSEHHVHERRAITLGETSSCNDVSNYQEENGISHIEADMYNDLNANTTLATWVVENTWGSGNLEINGFVSKFAAPYGVGQTFSCGIPNSCPRINCADLQDPSAPGTGPGYAILISFANFNLYMNTLWEALNLSKDDWNGVQVKLQQTYYPYNTPSILLKELINGLSAMAWLSSAAAGPLGAAPAAGVGSVVALMAGVFGGVNLALSESDQSLANLAELEANTQTWYQTIFNELVWTNNNLTQEGFYKIDEEGVEAYGGLPEMVADGKWLDYTDIAILNDDSSKAQVNIAALKEAFYTYLLANMVNYAWRAQGVFFVKYKMSQDDYESRGDDWNAGGGSDVFRTWDDDYAYFLQSWFIQDDGLFAVPKTADPPGFDETANDLNGCDPGCIMRSTAKGFKDHGYNYNFSTNAADYTGDQASALGWLTDLPSVPGFFNIPVVDLTGNDWAQDADALDKLLSNPKDPGFDENGQKALFCYVQDNQDANGVKFVDQFDPELVELFYNNCAYGYDPQ